MQEYILSIVAFEITRRCGYDCKHCRAIQGDLSDIEELSTAECYRILENISRFAKPIVILTGGEPLSRGDIFKIAQSGTNLGLKMALASCGNYIDNYVAQRIKDTAIHRVSLSIDGVDKATHDFFRGKKGAFDIVLNAAKIFNDHKIDFQVNTTITKHNYQQLEGIIKLVMDIGAVSFHPFLLVPTGRAKEIADWALSAREYEDVLNYLWEQSVKLGFSIKPTCAPHYYRIFRERRREIHLDTYRQIFSRMSKGCLGGQSFAFISHTGKVQICGFLDIEAGDLRKNNYNFREIWENSSLFQEIRDIDSYHGKCGYCEFRYVCGGCRARAYTMTGNYLNQEPLCSYIPKKKFKPG